MKKYTYKEFLARAAMRRKEILLLVAAGVTKKLIARKFKVSAARISQIVNEK